MGAILLLLLLLLLELLLAENLSYRIRKDGYVRKLERAIAIRLSRQPSGSGR